MTSVMDQAAPLGEIPVTAPPRAPMLASCRSCKHVWPFLWIPCDARLISKAVPKICPWCGGAKKEDILMASSAMGDLARYVVWLETEVDRARWAVPITDDR